MPSPHQRILVIGATGTTGRLVADGLRAEGHQVLGVARHTEPRFVWAEPSTHDAVLDRVGAVYLLAPVGVLDVEPVMLGFVERALAAGVRRCVLLSAAIAPIGSPGLGAVHEQVARLAPEFCAVRPSWFMQNFIEDDHWFAQGILAEGRICTSVGPARVAFVDAADVAAVAVRALVDPELPGDDLIVTGPEALSYDDVAREIATTSGRRVVHEHVSPTAVRDRIVAAGVDPSFAEMHAGLDELIRAGAEEQVTDTVQRVSGRPPRSFAEFALRHAGRWIVDRDPHRDTASPA